MTTERTVITIEATVNAPVDKVWDIWTSTKDIVKWSSPSPEWYTPKADHDLTVGGTFNYRMEARDGSFGFDFQGVFDEIRPNEYLEYTIAGDGRKVKIDFKAIGNKTHIVQKFEAETINSIEQQRTGWQAILNSFKNYVEENK